MQNSSNSSVDSTFFNKIESVVKSKYFSIFVALLFLSISIYVTIHTRDGQKDFSGLKPLIEQNIYSQIHSNIQQQVDSQYPIGTADFKSKIVEQEYSQIVKTGLIPLGNQDAKISDIVDQNLAGVKSNFQFPDGQTYMGSIDPYYYYVLANDLYDHGYTGEKLDANGNPRITMMLAPHGVNGQFSPEFNIWIIAKVFALNHVTKTTTDSQKFGLIFMLPVWLCLPAVFACFFIIRRFSSNLYALYGTLICMSVGIFVSRTLGGSIDNDPYYVIMPLIITAFFFYALLEKRIWLAIILAVLAGFSQGLMALMLSNAWFIFFFIIVASIMYIVYALLVGVWNKELHKFSEIMKREGLVLGTYLISTLIFNYYFVSSIVFNDIINGIVGNTHGISSFDAANIWPNVLSSVAELNPASFGQIVGSVGGATIFILGLLGLVLLALDFEWKRPTGKWMKWVTILFSIIWFSAIVKGNAFQNIIANNALLFLVILFIPVAISLFLGIWNNHLHARASFVILISVWMAGTTYMSFNGVRFIMILGPTFAIAFALCLYYIARSINSFFKNELGMVNIIAKNVFGILVAFLIFIYVFSPIYTQAMQMSSQPSILFDRAWFDAMDVVRAQTSPDAIVTSWWDFGHFYHAIGQRAVTFDGASQTTPQAHWVGRLLMENNESVARDMLRMLVCGANDAFDKMLEVSKDPTNGVLVNKLIYKTFGLSLGEDEKLLQNNEYFNFTPSQTKEIMSLLSCDNPRENIFITSGDMVGKASVWAHWGSWDFTKKYVFDNYHTMSVQSIAAALHEEPTLISKYVTELNQLTARSRSQNIKYTDLINQWFAPYPGYYPGQSGYFGNCNSNNKTITCDNSLIVTFSNAGDSFNATTSLQAPPIGRVLVVSQKAKSDMVIYSQEDKFPAGSTLMDALLIQNSNTTYSVLLAQTPLGGSLFTRLFFLDGQTTKYFSPVGGTFNSQTQGKISIWKTNWTAN